MKKYEGIPKPKNIPSLSINAEGLRKHSLLCMFAPEPSMPPNDGKLRAWLLHTVLSAARHYSKARELVQLQNSPRQHYGGGTVFFTLDVNEQLEDCIAATFRICRALKRMKTTDTAVEFCTKNEEAISQLEKVRNQFEHMHQQIVSKETGNGPISITYGDEGRTIRFRSLRLETAQLHRLIEGAFHVVSTYFPAFDPNSAPEPSGPMVLQMSPEVTQLPVKE